MPIARNARHTLLYKLGNVLAHKARQGMPLNHVMSLWLAFTMVLQPTSFSKHIATLSQPFLHRTVPVDPQYIMYPPIIRINECIMYTYIQNKIFDTGVPPSK